MKKTTLILCFAVLVLLVSSFIATAKFTEEINKDYTSSFDKWTYKESRSKKHPSFTLTHEWKSPAYKSGLNTDNDALVRGRSSAVFDNKNNQDYYALRDAFQTFNSRRNRASSFSGYIRNLW